jgi:hypothetical protein
MACPICHKDADQRYRPFCSRRCADIDLGRWLTGGYVLPGGSDDDGQAPVSDGPEGTPDRPAPPGGPRGPRRH